VEICKWQPQKIRFKPKKFCSSLQDDIGWFTVSAYNMGLWGYRTAEQ